MSGTEAARDEDFFRELADGAPVMIWMAGLDMGCFYFNRAWLDFRGRTLGQESGNGWAEGVHPDDLKRCVSHYVSCFEDRAAFAMSYRLLNAAGQYRWILDRGAPHFQVDGSFLGYFGGCADLEEQSSIERNRELGSSLTEMTVFAQNLATEKADSKAPHSPAAVSLPTFARQLQLDNFRRKQHAVADMRKLATDMAAYAKIPQGACVT